MGNYSVEIAGFPGDEVNFSNSTSDVSVAVGESKIVSFDGTYLRTAILNGEVSAEGDGLEGVLVSLSGGPDKDRNPTTRTNKDGLYAFENLRGGAYQVGISDYDDINYGFDRPSRNVTLVLGGTATVDFEGTLLRTSGISGRVSVDGRGIPEAKVTLSGGGLDEDRTATTDVGGQYAFTGLAAGDYTVAISDVDTAAYVFEATSQDVKLGDDESKIVNFEGAHATTASISGHLYVDEATKNDAYDEGENRLEAAGIAVVLVGPNSLSERLPTATDAEGNFSFTGLRAGPYQLLVVPTPETTPANYGYGGLATGYAITLAVGQSVTQNIPFDITHQHVHFQVNLRNADAEGDALEGATVTLYSDAAGTSRISGAQATTDAEGVARLHFARAGATGHTAYASVTAPDGFGVGGDMQMVQWDAQSPEHQAENSQHVLNLNATFPFEGKTITTELGGGVALGEWAINVTHGDDHETVEGAPSALDADGKGTVEMSAAGVADLPMTYYVALADDQHDDRDGGEAYITTDTMVATHTGLSANSTMETGTLEARYTTAKIEVYVHREVDQARGYTGGVAGSGRDVRASNVLDLNVRHIVAGRPRILPEEQEEKWSRPENNDGSVKYTSPISGKVVFTGVPTQYDVVVQASKKNVGDNTIIVLDADEFGIAEIATYTALEENGVKGGAFGEQGGFHHTVELCPLEGREPTGQDFGRCGSFAYANTHAVTGQLWRNTVVASSSNDGFVVTTNRNRTNAFVRGSEVSVSPLVGQNLAGEANGFTAAASDNRNTPDIDERWQFDFGRMAEGIYTVTVPDGWAASTGTRMRLHEATNIVVTPATGTLYGRVVRADNKAPVGDATVVVNGQEVTTDRFGRYIVHGYGRFQSIRRGNTYLNATVSADGFRTWYNNPNVSGSTVCDAQGLPRGCWTNRLPQFAANSPVSPANDIELSGAPEFTWINGTVRTPAGDPVAGAEIQVRYATTIAATLTSADFEAPLNANSRVQNFRPRARRINNAWYVLRTGADGTFRAQVQAGTPTEPQPVRISVLQAGSTLIPYDGFGHLAIVGTEISASFTAFTNPTIEGTVWGPDGRPLKDVTVTVGSSHPDRPDGQATAYTTGATGIFIVNASSFADNITVTPERRGYNINPASWTGRVTQGQTLDLDGTSTNYFTGSTNPAFATSLRSVTIVGIRTISIPNDDGIWSTSVGSEIEQVTIEATPAQDNATAKVNGTDANAGAAGHQVNLQPGTNTFTITVRNGSNQDTHTLIINRGREVNRPSAPRNLGATSPGSGQLRFTWQTPTDGSSLIAGYQWRIKNGSRPVSNWVKIRNPTPGNGDGYVLALGGDAGGENGLVDGRSNIIEIRAFTAVSDTATVARVFNNHIGHTASFTATSWPEIATVELTPSAATEGTTESVTLTISTGAEGAAYSDYHVVLDVPNAVRHLVSFPNAVLISASETSVPVTVRVLDDNRAATSGTTTEVRFTVLHQSPEAAGRSRDDGTDRATLTITDDDLAPGTPAAPTVTNVNSNNLNTVLRVNWNPPDTNPTGITHYNIRWRTGTAQWSSAKTSDGDTTSHTITGLRRNTLYEVQIQAVNKVGESAWSDSGTATTQNNN